jgi:hypothetical protein
MISTILSDGKFKIVQKIVDDKKWHCKAFISIKKITESAIFYGIPLWNTLQQLLLKEVDEEIVNFKRNLISETT